ncbi:MAG: hypothetical protein Q9218_004411 [Villophora microphyllina]
MARTSPPQVKAPTSFQRAVQVNMSIEAGTGLSRMHAPVHESMTLAALIASKYNLDKGTTIYKLRENPQAHSEINDFIRGIIWNDDPACLLFDDNTNNDNLNYSTGLMWATKFTSGKQDPYEEHNIIGRSHFGDLQFLHGMGSAKGEWPTETRNNILSLMEIMYKLACGNQSITPDTQIKDTWLRRFFTAFSTPNKYDDLRELLTDNHKTPANVKHRAMGSLFHLIQDSYTHGHTRRVLLNPEDQDRSSSTLKFKSGTYGRWGEVTNFHTYKGQDGDAHSRYDYADIDMTRISPSNLDAFNVIIGARDGIEKCIRLTNYWCNKTLWDDGVRQYLEDTVFKLANGATGSDDSVE